MFKNLDELEIEIKQLKKELIETALAKGLNNCHTISCSQKLDKLITIYQKLTYQKQTI
jgi:stage 0 sporulation regulatory protein